MRQRPKKNMERRRRESAGQGRKGVIARRANNGLPSADQGRATTSCCDVAIRSGENFT